MRKAMLEILSLSLPMVFFLLFFPENVRGQEKIGIRPYEMDWARRTEDTNPPLIDFETAFGEWKIETKDAIATFIQSREEQIFGKYVAKLTYRKEGVTPVVTARPPQPISVPENGFDAMSCWIYGNNWAWVTDKETPQVTIEALFLAPDGKETAYTLAYVQWKEWFLCHHRFTDQQQTHLHQKGVCFNGFRVLNGRNEKDRILYFDNFALFKEEFKPLSLTQRPQRGIDMFPGQSAGQNTGEGRLPFPTREETIEPDSAAKDSKNSLVREGNDFVFRYDGSDGILTLRYTPESGTWSDFKATWNHSNSFEPLAQGGVNQLVKTGTNLEPIVQRTLLEANIDGNKLIAHWRLHSAHIETEVEYNMELRGKSLVLDTFSKGGKVAAVEFGKVNQILQPRPISIPYYDYAGSRPKAVLFQLEKEPRPLFILGNIDWYRSNGSHLIGATEKGETFAATNGQVQYNPKTDGTRNDVFERFFITISPELPEIFPNIPNPPSPWKHITGKGVWRAFGASSNRENDKKYWRDIWRHGMRHIIVTDHETGWRDEGESFTFRTEPAPKKGGDQGQYDYARFMRDQLGFVYGPYNNFTDFAPVNSFWNDDMVSRTSTNELQHAWTRCYAPKPSRAVEYCEKLTPIIQQKFNFNTAYCDVHTSVTPWGRTDYDARVPGAGTFAATFYPYGEIMLIQKENWKGPVYSEGPHHCFYSGLTDGNYAQDRGYYFPGEPWLVDFDLLKMHNLECNFGMGDPNMYDPKLARKTLDSGQWLEFIDRYIAAMLAFGHPGFLATYRGMNGGMASYFMVQQIASHYTQVAVEQIQYCDETGKGFPISEALANEVFKRNQLAITYQDGTTLFVNGSLDGQEMMVETKLPIRNESTGKVELQPQSVVIPPNGYLAFTNDYAVSVLALCHQGRRYDYCDSPEYIYLNGRGTYQKLPKAAGAGQGVCRLLDEGKFEVIVLDNQEMGFAIDANQATAFDYDGKELGPAKLQRSGDYLFVKPVSGAFSYTLEKNEKMVLDETILLSDRILVVAGETVTASCRHEPTRMFELTIPTDAKVGEIRWFEPIPGATIHFFIAPLVEVKLSLTDDTTLTILANNHLSDNPEMKVTVTIDGKEYQAEKKTFSQGDKYKTAYIATLDDPLAVKSEQIVLTFSVGTFHQTITRETKISHQTQRCLPSLIEAEGEFCAVPTKWAQLRGQEPTTDYRPTLTNINKQSMYCNGQAKEGYFIHPPYQGGVGRAWLEYDFTVPQVKESEPVLRAFVGKQDGSDLGDGILHQIILVTPEGMEQILAEKTVLDHQWYPLEANLAPYVGKKIKLRLVSDVGIRNQSSGDWSCWGEPRLETANNVFRRIL